MSTTARDTTPATKAFWPRRRRWLVIALAAPLLALVAFALFLFKTGAGRDLVLDQLRSALGPQVLHWEEAEGHLSGGLTLRGLRYAADGTRIELGELSLDLDALALLGGTLHLRHLESDEGRILLAMEESPPEPWPERLRLPASLPEPSLPMAVEIDALQVRRLTVLRGEETLLAVDSLSARAAFSEGAATVESLELSGSPLALRLDARIDTANHWATALRAQIDLSLPKAEPLALDLGLSGRLDDLALRLATRTEPANRIELRATGGLPEPRWSLQVEAPQLRPGWFGAAGEALALQLGGEGDLTRAALEGHLRQGDQTVELGASELSYDQRTLRLSPLALGLFEGRLTVEGQVDLAPAQPNLALLARWDDLALTAGAQEATRSTGQARLDGPLDGYALRLDGDLRRKEEQAKLTLSGRGSTQALDIGALQVQLPAGALEASGRVAWDPQPEAALDLRLSDFDPAWFAPAFPGSIRAELRASGALVDGAPRGQLDATRLEGTLRGQPLHGEASAQMEADGSGHGQLDLRLGGSHLRGEGRWGERLDARLAFSPLRLPDWLDDAEGELRGEILLRGSRRSPGLEAHIDAGPLALAGLATERLALRAELVEDSGAATLSLEAQRLTLAGQSFEHFSLSGEGDRGQHRVELALDGLPGRLGARIDGGLSPKADLWRGTLLALALEPRDHPAWRLREPAAISLAPRSGTFTLEDACLDAAPAFACLSADSASGALEGELALQDFDLAQLTPLLGGGSDPGFALRGELDATAQVSRSAAGALRGHLSARIPEIALQPTLDPRAAPIELREFALDATFAPDLARLELDSRATADGHLRAEMELADPDAADGALRGTFDLLLPDISAVDGFSDQVIAAQGRIEGALRLSGTRAAPEIDGQLELTGLAAQIPALGLKLHDGTLRARRDTGDAIALEGSLGLGEGVLELAGDLQRDEAGRPVASATLRGENLTVMDTSEARLRASPDLRLHLADGRLKLRGEVAVPFARIDLEQLQSVRTPSSDVLIVDEETPDAGALAVDADLGLSLGEDVRMKGYGLSGTLAGKLRVRDRPGKATTARGAIEVGGAYKAYGQDLSITRGRVAWASTPIDTPALDVRAQRKIDTITVGVQVRGTALAPELTLWSDPAMDQAEQLSYLILGRPLRSASQADGAQLTQAAAAFGGNLLAKNLGAQLGVDEIEVADNRALGGAALTVGKKLSPRLHVSYGVALFGPGQVITFKYLLSRLWNIQIDSGTENRAALNYRLER